uniref:Avl9 domain-containing protein n=1 Tax=Gongylonema pulchrum TaxID=637853 RepID=A0A183E0F8_9BILA
LYYLKKQLTTSIHEELKEFHPFMTSIWNTVTSIAIGGPRMSATVNKVSNIFDSSDFDEETWLVQPPGLSSQSDTTHSSGRILEWLQGAAMNVDFQTRSALSRKLAIQAAKKS